MKNNVCPVWVGYILASPVRKFFQNPERILRPHIKSGMTVLDIGCAMGFFSLPMAQMTGPNGRVICVDIQKKMLQSLKKRAAKANLAKQLEFRLATGDSFGIDDIQESIDFTLASAVLHEVPDQAASIRQIYKSMKPGALFLISEPDGRVSRSDFEKTMSVAEQAGFTFKGEGSFRKTHSAFLEKSA